MDMFSFPLAHSLALPRLTSNLAVTSFFNDKLKPRTHKHKH